MARQVQYSPGEQRALKLLTGKPQDTNLLCDKFYKPDGGPPYYGRQIVLGLMNSLIRKSKHNGEKFIVKKSKRAGPWPITFWREDRK